MNVKSVLTGVRKNIALITIGLAAVWVLEYFGAFLGMSHFCYDLFFRLRGPAAVPENVVIVAVDERSLNTFGQWPIKRRHWAQLLESLGQASVVGFDILMIEPSEDDALVAAAVEKHGRVIFPVYITKDTRMIQYSLLFKPLNKGHVHIEQDIDGVVRQIHHTLYSETAILPSFSSIIYEAATGRLFERDAALPDPAGAYSSGPKPILQRDNRRIDYFGPQGSFPVFSMQEVIAGRYATDYFQDKIVLVGVTAEGLEAGVLTPFSQQRNHMSGVEAHAHILGNLIGGRGITAVPAVWLWGGSLLFAAVFFFCLLWSEGWRVVALWASGIIAALAFSFLLFACGSIWMNPIPVAVLLLIAFFLAYIVRMEADAKQLQEANNLWEDSFDSIEEAIWLTDLQGAVLKQNQGAQKLLSEKAISRVLHDGIFKKIKESYTAAAQDGSHPSYGRIIDDEIADIVADRHFTVKVVPRRCEGSSSAGYVVVVRDISEQKRAAREKQQMQSDLMQAQKMKVIGTLAGGVAHDFNNILMGIQGYVSLLLLEVKEDDPRFEKIKKIETQVQSAARLTRQLLGLARGGKYEIKPLDLNALIEKSLDIFGRTKKEITVCARYQESVWPVAADAGQLEQILLNMYINSWQAMPQGGDLYLETKNIVLSNDDVAGRGVPSGRYVKISVTDTGVGMDEATRRRVFEPFFTTKEPGKGTGLGLASAYNIIANHDGFVELESESGKGSTFNVYLPAAGDDPPVSDSTPEQNPRRGQETVLIVDDDPLNVTVMKEILETLGYRVLCAGNGQEALSIYMIKKDAVDLIVLDMIMPGMGGGATFDAIRSVNPQAKILLSSGYSLDGEAGRILERGCNGFIQKPFRIGELSEKIRDVLDRQACLLPH